jgi:hypothetical protein
MAIGQVARLENQVKEAQRIVTVRDAKIRELQHSLSKATQSRLSAETELSRAVEMHETRMAALQLEYRSAEMQLETLRESQDRIMTPQRMTMVPSSSTSTTKPETEVEVPSTVPPPQSLTRVMQRITPRLSSGRKGRELEKETQQLRQANKKLHEHVQQGRSALAAVSAMRARRLQAASSGNVANKQQQQQQQEPPPPQSVQAQVVVPVAMSTPPSRLAERLAEKNAKAGGLVVVVPPNNSNNNNNNSMPKQLSHDSPVASIEVIQDKENIRAVENSNSVLLSANKKTPSRVLRRLSLMSPTESSLKRTSSSKTPRSQRRLRTPLRDTTSTVM